MGYNHESVSRPHRSMANSNKIALLLINTGSPDAPTEEAVRRYLAEFLGDRRIVELPRWKWWPILHGIILRTRPKKSAERYRGVWTDEGSPLIVHTRRTAGALEAELGIPVYWSMRYGSPSTASVLDRMKADGVGRVLVMPMFAQYASQTTAACLDGVSEYQLSHVDAPAVRTIHDYHDDPAYIDALAAHVRAYWDEHGSPVSTGGRLVMSFHGIPQASSNRGDVYEAQTCALRRFSPKGSALRRARGACASSPASAATSGFVRIPSTASGSWPKPACRASTSCVRASLPTVWRRSRRSMTSFAASIWPPSGTMQGRSSTTLPHSTTRPRP